MINRKAREEARKKYICTIPRFRIPKPITPYYLFEYGVAPLDMKLFNKIKEKLDNEEISKVDLVFFDKKVRELFSEKGLYSFFALKESQKDLEPEVSDISSIVMLYWYTYIIARKFKKEKNNYSPEELSFLFIMEGLGKEIELIHGAPNNFPFEYKFLDLLYEFSRKIYYLVGYLKDLGFNGKPKRITFRDKIEEFNKLYKSYIIQRYHVIINEEEKDRKVHDAVIEQFKKLKKELRVLEEERLEQL